MKFRYIFSLLFIAVISSTSAFAQETQNKVLAGLTIRHGDIIDAIQPIYRTINDDKSLGEIINGQKYGGNGGSTTTIYRDGFVVVGFIYQRGEWMGEERIAGLQPVLQQWTKDGPKGDRIIAGQFGMIDKIRSYESDINTPLEGLYVSDLQVVADDFVSNISISFGGELPKVVEAPTLENLKYDSKDDYYIVDIQIISGTKSGQLASGIVSFAKDQTTANRIIFHYDGGCYTMKDMSQPTATIENNSLRNLIFVGGPNDHRFGVNGGFNRKQFGREIESFIPNGEEYFGYLDPSTYVDGAGNVKYRKVKNREKSIIFKEYSCSNRKAW